MGKATSGLNGLYCQDGEAWGGPVFQGLVQPKGGLSCSPDQMSSKQPSPIGHPALC